MSSGMPRLYKATKAGGFLAHFSRITEGGIRCMWGTKKPESTNAFPVFFCHYKGRYYSLTGFLGGFCCPNYR